MANPVRFRKASPCPICQGYQELPHGQGQRCYGFLSTDGTYAHCTREEHAGALKPDPNGDTYAHRLIGDCHCGVRHDPTFTSPPTTSKSNGYHATIAATYDYVDAEGQVLYQTVRLQPKNFYQRRPDGHGGWINSLKGVRPVIYRLPEVLEAIAHEKVICLAEGEADVNALARFGYTATCNHGGAGKWTELHSRFLEGAVDVVCFGDNDEAGRKHLTKQVAALKTVGLVPRIAQLDGLQDHGDIREWLTHHTQQHLDQIVMEATPADMTEETGDAPVRTFPRLDDMAYTLATLQREELPALIEVMPGLLPEGFGIIAGPSGHGKSYFCLQLALAVCSGLKCLGQWETCASDVLYLGTEDSKRRMKSRVDDLGEEYNGKSWPANCTVVHQPQTLESGLVAQITEWLEDHPQARLILIDMFADVRGPRKQQGNWYEEDRQAGKQLSHLANERHICIMATMHTNRLRQSEDPFERVYGGDGVLGACDIKTVLLPTSTWNQHTWSLKGRDVPEQHYTLSFVEGLWVYEGVKMADASEERRAILHYFTTWPGAHGPDEVSKALEKNAATIRGIMSRMAKAGSLREGGVWGISVGSLIIENTSTVSTLSTLQTVSTAPTVDVVLTSVEGGVNTFLPCILLKRRDEYERLAKC